MKSGFLLMWRKTNPLFYQGAAIGKPQTVQWSCIYQTQLQFVTQYGPIGVSSPVSTGVLEVSGGGAPSALGAPPARGRDDRAAPRRLPSLCKRRGCIQDHQQASASPRVTKVTGRSSDREQVHSQVKGKRLNTSRKRAFREESIRITELKGKEWHGLR